MHLLFDYQSEKTHSYLHYSNKLGVFKNIVLSLNRLSLKEILSQSARNDNM